MSKTVTPCVPALLCVFAFAGCSDREQAAVAGSPGASPSLPDVRTNHEPAATTKPVAGLAPDARNLPVPAFADDDPALLRARRVLRHAPLFDGHNDLVWEIRRAPAAPMDVAAYDLRSRTRGHTDLARLAEGGVGGQFWSVYVPGEFADSGYARLQLEEIDIARRVIARYPELELALTASDVESAIASGKIASLIGMEGGHALENSLGALRAYYALGVRCMTLTHNVTLDWADAAMDKPRHGGLTPFGEEVVREMNRLGMLVDLSHASPGTMSDALNVTEAPVIFSHSSARALTDVPRNVPDSILARIPANRGVVMATFVQPFVYTPAAEWEDAFERLKADLESRGLPASEVEALLDAYRARNPRPVASIQDIADHIDHIRGIVGVDHVGIGSDFDGMTAPPQLADVSQYPYLFAELVQRGWTDEDLAKLASVNILRVMREAEEVARRLQDERPASTRTITSPP